MSRNIELSGPELKPKSGKKAKQLVILLHGLGADGDDLFGLAPYFADHLPDTQFISLNAPYPCDMAPYGLQWFSLQNRSEEAILSGIREVAPILNNYIDKKLKEMGLKEKDLAIIGFSQGTMLSLYTFLRRPEPVAGVLAFSGALVAPQLLKKEMTSKPPICLVHGEDDDIVPFEAFETAIQSLQRLEVPVSGYSREGLGHGIDPAGIQIGIEFLREVFGYKDNTISRSKSN